MNKQLPKGYEVLEPFVDFWAVDGTALRDQRRGESTAVQRKAFYETAKGLVPKALEELDRKPLEHLDDNERCLLNLLLSFAHVTQAVEMLDKAEPRHAAFRKVMRITHSPADV